MGKSAPQTPPVPDPTAIAQAQEQANTSSADYQSQLNNTNQSSPYGSIQYVQNPTTGQWTETTQLSPQEQANFNSNVTAQGTALNSVNTALAQGPPTQAPLTSSVPTGPITSSYATGGPVQNQINTPDTSAAVNQAIDASYGEATNLLNPQWNQATEQNTANLVAEGLNPNDAAYGNAMGIFNANKNEAYDQAANMAVQTGQAEQNTLFGQAATSGEFTNAAQAQANSENAAAAGFANTAQNQQVTQALSNAQLNNAASQQEFTNAAYAQELPINEFDALMSGNQVQAPTSAPAQTQVAPTDVTGAYALQQQALQEDYQSQMANYQSGLGGLFNLGSAALLSGGSNGGLPALAGLLGA